MLRRPVATIFSLSLLCGLVLPIRALAQGPSGEHIHLYSPSTNLERTELEFLRTATKSVDVAMYSFTDRELAEELAKLARSGVKVRVYRDRTEYGHEVASGDRNTTEILAEAGIEVRVKAQRDLMHLKAYAVDARCVRSGSANWSPTGLKRQDNDLRYECSAPEVEQFSREFEELWARPTNISVTRHQQVP